MDQKLNINFDASKGSIFDESQIYKNAQKKLHAKSELSSIIHDLEEENRMISSERVDEIINRLKDLKRNI